MKSLLGYCLCCILIHQTGKLDAQSFAWAKSMGSGFTHPVLYPESGTAIVSDANGNVYTTGYFADTVDFDPGIGVFYMIADSTIDFFLSKLDAQGNFLWAKKLQGTEGSYGYGIALDNSGNIMVTGYFRGTKDFDVGPGTFNLTAIGADIFILKLNSNGNFLWAKEMGGTGNEAGFSITVDSEGNIFIAGRFEGTVDFAPGSDINNISSAGSFDVFIVKLNSNGIVLWVRKAGGLGMDYGNAIVVDSGNVYITGCFTGAVDFDPGTDSAILTAVGTDIYVWKLDSAGNLVWVEQMKGTVNSYGSGIAVDAGNIYYTGWFKGSVDFDPGIGTTAFTSLNNNQDIIISKLNSSGNLIWAKQIGGVNSDEGLGINVDNSGNIYTTGYFQSAVDFNPGTGTANLTATGGVDIFILKLDPVGNFGWAVKMGGNSADVGNAIYVNESGIHTTGSFVDNVDFDPGAGIFQLTSLHHSDIFIQKLTHTTTEVSNIDPDIESIILSPNPVSGVAVLTVYCKKSKKMQWKIVDINGRLVSSFRQIINIGRNNNRIYTGNLSKGEYLLIGYSNDGKTKAIPFIKYY